VTGKSANFSEVADFARFFRIGGGPAAVQEQGARLIAMRRRHCDFLHDKGNNEKVIAVSSVELLLCL